MADIHDIVRLCARTPYNADKLCTKLGISGRKLADLIKARTTEGYSVKLKDGLVYSRSPSVIAETKPINLGSTSPGRKVAAVVSDLHAGSSHFHGRALQRFLAKAWKKGARVAIIPGDVLDGNAPVLLPDQVTSRWDGQCEILAKTLAKCPPFQYVAIDGNHDGYFSARSGLSSGKLLQSELRSVGVDWTFAGTCLGRPVVNGARIHMYHGNGGAGTRNAIRRILNARVEGLEEPADALFMGHYHKFVTVATYPERVFACAPGTFQEKRSEFANRIVAPWDVGGALASWTVYRDKTVGEFSAEFHPIAGGVWEA